MSGHYEMPGSRGVLSVMERDSSGVSLRSSYVICSQWLTRRNEKSGELKS